MPFDQYTTRTQVETVKRRQRAAAEEGGYQAGAPPPDTYRPIETVDKAAYKTLSTSVVMHLAGLGGTERDLAHASRVIANAWAVPPEFVWGNTDPDKYRSPITGAHLSMQEARLFSNNFGAVPVASMLKDALNYTEGSGYKTSRGQQSVNRVSLDPNDVAKFARTIHEHVPDMSIQDGMGMSIYLTRQGVNPKQFAQNLDWVRRFLAISGSNTISLPSGDGQVGRVKGEMNAAIAFTIQGARFRSLKDVQDFIAPGARSATETLQTELRRAPDSTDQPYSQYTTEQRAQNAQTNALKSGQIAPSAKGMVGTDYWAEVTKEQNRIKLDQDAFENSWYNQVLIKPGGVVLRNLNVLYQDTTGVVVLAAGAIGGVTVAPLRGHSFSDSYGEARYAANRLWQAPGWSTEAPNATLGYLMAEPLGDKYAHWVGPGLDLLFSWYIDPLAIAGRARAAYEAGFMLPGLLEHGAGLDQIIAGANNARTGAGALKTFLGHLDSFAKSGTSRKMFERDNTFMNRAIYQLRGKVEARGTLDLPFMTALKKEVDNAIEGGMSKADAWQAWQDGIKAHFLGTAPGPYASPKLFAGEQEKTSMFAASRDRYYTGVDMHAMSPYMDDTGYLYHTSAADEFDSIRSKGLLPGKVRPGEPTGVYFAEDVADITGLRPGRYRENDVLFRVKKDMPGLQKTSMYPAESDFAEWVAPRVVKQSEVQFLGADGEWHLLQDRSISQKVVKARLNEGIRSDTIVDKTVPTRVVQPPLFYEHNGLFLSKTDHQALMADAVNAVDEARGSTAFPGWLRTEVPGSTVLSRFGPRRLIRSAVTSEKVTSTAIGKRAAALPNMNPGRVFDINDNPAGYIYEHATRWSVFDEVQTRAFETRMADILNSGFQVEKRASALIDEINDKAFASIIAKYNIDPDVVTQLKAKIFEPEAASLRRQQMFGVVDDVAEKDRPLMETQLMNQRFVMDPVTVRQGIRRYVDMRDRMYAAFKKETGSIADVSFDKSAFDKLADGSGQVFDAWLRFWKSTTVARPAYVTRVVLGDENLRFLATTSSAKDRFLSLGLGHRATSPEDANFIKKYLDEHYTQEMKVGDETITIPRAGAYEYEATAAGQVRQADAIEQMLKGSDKLESALKTDGSWIMRDGTGKAIGTEAKAITPDQTLKAWSGDLVNQTRQSAPGTLALQSVKDGDTLQQTAAKLKAWAQADRYVTLRSRLGYEADEVDIWADKLSKMIHSYTAGDKGIATLALEGDRSKLEQAMKELLPDPADRPIIHSPSLIDATDGSAATKVTNWLYEKFVRMPEDSLNRQPFYAVWKRRAEVSMYGAMDAKGITLTDQLKTAVDNASREFALGQVRRVMFDFTKQSRFTELMQFVFPFPQPFFEGFQAWGHIAYRNPLALVHMKQLVNFGVQTGFVQKDPLSGEWMVPARYPYQQALRWTATGLGVDPEIAKHIASPWMPASGLSLLSSSTVQFGAGGPLSGLPVFMPGMHPPIQAFAMWASRNSTSPLLQSYLFQYGPDVTLWPRPVIAAANAIGVHLPGENQESSRESMALTIIEAAHRYGLDKDENGNIIPLNEAERKKMEAAGLTPGGEPGQTLEDWANDQANTLLAAKGLVNLFAPTALRLSFEGQREDYAAWQSTLKAHGGDYRVAIQDWFKKYGDKSSPDYDPSKWFIPAGRTQTGEGYGEETAVRIPASELVYQMFRMKGIGDLMKAYKPYAALLLIGTDPEVQSEQNFMAFSDLLNKHLVHYDTPSEYYGAGASGQGWAAYSKWKASHYTQIESMVDKYGSFDAAKSHHEYDQYIADRQEFFNQMYVDNPHWALANLVYSPETKSWDFPSDYSTNPNDTIAARADLRHVLEAPGFGGFPGVVAMQGYMERTDKIEETMKRYRITDINSSRAQDMGLFDKYAAAVEDTVKAQPDTAQFFTKYFGVSFDESGKVIDTTDLMFNTTESKWLWSEVPKPLRDDVTDFDHKLWKFRNDAREKSLSSLDRTEFYAKADSAMRQMWRDNPNIVKQWYKAQGWSAQRDYQEYAAVKPMEFWSAFDFAELGGIKLPKREQDWMSYWAEARLNIARKEDADPAGYSSSEGYDGINAGVRELLQKHPKSKFADVIKAVNTWGWGIDNVLGYGKKDADGSYKSNADRIWGTFLKFARGAQGYVNSQGLQGLHYGTDAEITSYKNAQRAMEQWVKDNRAKNSTFDQQWGQLQELNGDPLIGSIFMPDDYYGPVGSVNYGG